MRHKCSAKGNSARNGDCRENSDLCNFSVFFLNMSEKTTNCLFKICPRCGAGNHAWSTHGRRDWHQFIYSICLLDTMRQISQMHSARDAEYKSNSARICFFYLFKCK